MGLIGRETALIGIPFFEAFFDEGEHLVVAEVEPWLRNQVSWRHLAGEALNYDIRVETFDEVDNKFDIIVERKQMKISGIGEIFVGHFSVFEYLQLMELYCS